MLNLKYTDYDKLLDNITKKIRSKSNNYDNRKEVFDYMLNNIKYDYEYLYKLKFSSFRKNRKEEIQDVLLNKKGICNSLAVTYKLLLEKFNIYSLCVCIKGHMLNLVYNDNGTFSFDDITKAIMAKDFKEDNIKIKDNFFLELIRPKGEEYDYFDYDYKKALRLEQGTTAFKNKYTEENIYWLPMSTIDYVYRLIRKRNLDYLKIVPNFFVDYEYKIYMPDKERIISNQKNI